MANIISVTPELDLEKEPEINPKPDIKPEIKTEPEQNPDEINSESKSKAWIAGPIIIGVVSCTAVTF